MKGRALTVARVVVGLFGLPALGVLFLTAQSSRDAAGNGSIEGIFTLAAAIAACFWAPFLVLLRGRIGLVATATVATLLVCLIITTYLYADPYGVASGPGSIIVGFLVCTAIGAAAASAIGHIARMLGRRGEAA